MNVCENDLGLYGYVNEYNYVCVCKYYASIYMIVFMDVWICVRMFVCRYVRM